MHEIKKEICLYSEEPGPGLIVLGACFLPACNKSPQHLLEATEHPGHINCDTEAYRSDMEK